MQHTIKKQRNYILLAFLIPLIIAVLFSCKPVSKGVEVPVKDYYIVNCNNDTIPNH